MIDNTTEHEEIQKKVNKIIVKKEKKKKKKEVRKLSQNMKHHECKNRKDMLFPDGYGVFEQTGQIVNKDKPRNKYGKVIKLNKKERRKLKKRRQQMEQEKQSIMNKVLPA